MKKTILTALAGLTLLLTGCTQQILTTNQGSAKPITDWKSYQNNNFSVKYPPYLAPTNQQEGLRTTISFQGTIPDANYTSVLSITTMPNQAGSTLDDWTNEVISQSKWIKQGSTTISEQVVYILTLPETDAGNRYVFLSKDSQTIFDVTLQYFGQETADLIIASFVLLK